MADVFISYAHSTAVQARAAADALRAAGYTVWLDEELPAHRRFSSQIEVQLTAAKAALVIWSPEAVDSDWVLSEADRAREDRKLVQVNLGGARLPMPFDQIQCADLAGWAGDPAHPGWRKALASIAELAGGTASSRQPEASAAETALPLPTKPSLAVLPFANLSNDPDQDYFADGMVAEIVIALSRHKSFFVIGSGSTFALKGRSVTPQEAARQLGVRYVLQGSVRRAAGRVRIVASLVDAIDGAQIWTQRFEDTLDDVFALQDRVALEAAGAIEPSVNAAEVARSARRPTADLNSYDLYLRAQMSIRAGGKDDWREAVAYLERAVALDPDFGAAWSILSHCHFVLVSLGWSDDPAAQLASEREGRKRGLRLAGDDPLVLGSVAMRLADLDQDIPGAIDLIERAVALNPGSAMVWMYSGVVRERAGEMDLAARHFETAIRLDPIGVAGETAEGFLAAPRFLQGRYEEAIALSKRYAQRVDGPVAFAFLAACYGALGDRQAARDALARYRAATPVPIKDYFRRISGNPAHGQAFLDALAVAAPDD